MEGYLKKYNSPKALLIGDRMRDIYIKDPDGEPEYDGEEETESEDDRYQRDWETSTLYW